MDRNEMITRLEAIREGRRSSLLQNISLSIRGDKIFDCITEVAPEDLYLYEGAVRIVINEDSDHTLVDKIIDEVGPCHVIHEITKPPLK